MPVVSEASTRTCRANELFYVLRYLPVFRKRLRGGEEGMRRSYNYSRLKDDADILGWGLSRKLSSIARQQREKGGGWRRGEKERWNSLVSSSFSLEMSHRPTIGVVLVIGRDSFFFLSFFFLSFSFCIVSNNRDVAMQSNFRGKLPRRGKRKITCNKMTKLLFYPFVGDCYWIAMPVVHNLWIGLSRQRKPGQIVLIKQLCGIIFYQTSSM